MGVVWPHAWIPWGVTSDHTEVFTSSCACVFPEDATERRQCFTDILRKFIVDQVQQSFANTPAKVVVSSGET